VGCSESAPEFRTGQHASRIPDRCLKGHVGAALRGRPSLVSKTMYVQRGAATEGRPYMYSTLNSISGTRNSRT
jgi:hypothetical protein